MPRTPDLQKIWTLLGAGTVSRDPSASAWLPISRIINSNLKPNFRPTPINSWNCLYPLKILHIVLPIWMFLTPSLLVFLSLKIFIKANTTRKTGTEFGTPQPKLVHLRSINILFSFWKIYFTEENSLDWLLYRRVTFCI